MTDSTSTVEQPYQWKPEPAAAELVQKIFQDFLDHSTSVKKLTGRLLSETGTKMIDWVDHFVLPRNEKLENRLFSLGFSRSMDGEAANWTHSKGKFPTIRLIDEADRRLVMKVEQVDVFLNNFHIDDQVLIEGEPLAQLRRAQVEKNEGTEFWVIERHGCRDFAAPEISSKQAQAVLHHKEVFQRRRRNFDNELDGFDYAVKLIQAAKEDLGIDWTCDLFFAAEREYWQSRNEAGRNQKARQDRLGVGWANHDHHTYRSSREHYSLLIEALEELGMFCRENFYAGEQAGWGAQVLEQPICDILVFADVDMSPSEVTGDFAHDGLHNQDSLGTIGLWCKLHGEAFLQAGMHHLECQFDFDASREQLANIGIETMQPFTDFPHLRQAFTEGEVWPIESTRINRLLEQGLIDPERAEKFKKCGTIGSHLEILERGDGYKGFNQSGISDIILKTDPRKW